MRYSRLSPEHLREAVSTLDKGLNKSVHNQEAQIGYTVLLSLEECTYESTIEDGN